MCINSRVWAYAFLKSVPHLYSFENYQMTHCLWVTLYMMEEHFTKLSDSYTYEAISQCFETLEAE